MGRKAQHINASYGLFPSFSQEIFYALLSITTSRHKRACKVISLAIATHRILLQTIRSTTAAILMIIFSQKVGLWPRSNKNKEFTPKLDSYNRLIAGFSTRM